MPTMHEIDYKIFGDDMQFVEVELDPMEAAVAEAGGMMYMEEGIEMETIFGDGSQQNSGLLGALMGAGKRLLTGESLFMTVFQNRGQGKSASPSARRIPAKSFRVHLAEIGGELLAQKDAFLCAAKGVSLGIAFTKRLAPVYSAAKDLSCERLQGDGLGVHSRRRHDPPTRLAAGEILRVDTGCIVAFQPSVDYDIQYVGKIKNRAVRRRRSVLRHVARTRKNLAAIAASQPFGRPHYGRRAANRPRWTRRRFGPRRPRPAAGRR